MRTSILILLATLPIVAASGQSSTTPSFSYRVGMKSPEGGPKMPNLRLGFHTEARKVSDSFTSRWEARMRGALDLTSRADRNPDDSFAEGAFGYQRALSGRSPEVLDTSSSAGTDYGMIGVFGDARYESNQASTERLGSAQLRAIYTHNHYTGAWILIPQAQVAWGITKSVGSDVRDSLNLASESNMRLEGEAYWNVDFSAFSTGAVSRASISAEWRGFSTSGLDARLESLGFDRGNYFAAEVGYAVKFWSVSGLYVRWSKGGLPSQPVDKGAWQVGVRRS